MNDEILEKLAEDKSLKKDSLFSQKLASSLHTYYIEDESNIEKRLMNIIGKSKLEKNIVLMPMQLLLLKQLEKTGNFVVSAPTSFGKTFLIMEYIKRNQQKLKKIVYIVHTKSLKDEIYDKISCYFSNDYNIIDNFNQIEELDNYICVLISDSQNIYETDENIDLLVVDEAYNLSKSHSKDRYFCIINTYKVLLNKAKKSILLGPYISELIGESSKNYTLLKTDYSPVTNRIFEGDDVNSLKPNMVFIEKIKKQENTIAYFNSKYRIYEYMQEIEKSDIPDIYEDAFIIMMEEKFPDFWLLPKIMRKGISIYHSSFPKYINRYNMANFNDGIFKGLITTSAILEGVNTSSKNLVIFETTIGNDTEKKLTPFQFFNLCGRVGRLGKEIVGYVYNFGDTYKEKYLQKSLPLFIGNENIETTEDKIDESILDEETIMYIDNIKQILNLLNIDYDEWHIKNKFYYSGIKNLNNIIVAYNEYREKLKKDIETGYLLTKDRNINKNKIIDHIYDNFIAKIPNQKYIPSSKFYAPNAIKVLLRSGYGGINFSIKSVCRDPSIAVQLEELTIPQKNHYIVELMNVGYNYIPHTLYNLIYIFNEFIINDSLFDEKNKKKIYDALFARLVLYVSDRGDSLSIFVKTLTEIGFLPSIIEKIKKYINDNNIEYLPNTRNAITLFVKENILKNITLEDYEIINLKTINII